MRVLVSCDEPWATSDRIFEGREDHLLFIELMKDATELWDIRIVAYCLMVNHYHMVINTPRGNISRCMRHMKNRSLQERYEILKKALIKGQTEA